MSKSILKLKLDLNTNKSGIKRADIVTSTPRTTAHKSLEKSSLLSKFVPKLATSTLHSRESSLLMTTSRKKLDSSSVLK